MSYWHRLNAVTQDDYDEESVFVLHVCDNTSHRRYLAAYVSALPVQALFGTAGVVAFLGSSLASVLILTTVNYVEHYGLTRKRLPSGKYENVSIHHSWYVPPEHSLTYLCPCTEPELSRAPSWHRQVCRVLMLV